MHRDDAGFVEHDRAGFFLFPVTTEIESSRFRIGKNVVVSLVQIWKLDRAAGMDGNQIGREQHVFLRHLRDVIRLGFRVRREVAFEINDRCRRIARRQRRFNIRSIALVQSAFDGRRRQVDHALQGSVIFGRNVYG